MGIVSNTMGKVMQIDKHAPEAVKEALDKKELSINRGYNITKEVQQLPEEQRERAAKEASVSWMLSLTGARESPMCFVKPIIGRRPFLRSATSLKDQILPANWHF